MKNKIKNKCKVSVKRLNILDIFFFYSVDKFLDLKRRLPLKSGTILPQQVMAPFR